MGNAFTSEIHGTILFLTRGPPKPILKSAYSKSKCCWKLSN